MASRPGGPSLAGSDPITAVLAQAGPVTHPTRARTWRSWLTTGWYVVATVVAAVGIAAAFRSPGPLATLVLACTAGLVVGGFTFAFSSSDVASAWRGVRVGLRAIVAAVVGIGLFMLLGPWFTAAVLGSMLATWPGLWYVVRRLRRGEHRATTPDTRDVVHGPAAKRRAEEVVTPAPVPSETVGGQDMTEFDVALLDVEEADDPDVQPSSGSSGRSAHPFTHADLDELCRMWRRSSVLVRQPLDPPRLAVVLQTRQHCLDELLRRDAAGIRAWMQAGGRLDDPRPFLTEDSI